MRPRGLSPLSRRFSGCELVWWELIRIGGGQFLSLNSRTTRCATPPPVTRSRLPDWRLTAELELPKCRDREKSSSRRRTRVKTSLPLSTSASSEVREALRWCRLSVFTCTQLPSSRIHPELFALGSAEKARCFVHQRGHRANDTCHVQTHNTVELCFSQSTQFWKIKLESLMNALG